MTRSRYAWTLAAILAAGALLRLGGDGVDPDAAGLGLLRVLRRRGKPRPRAGLPDRARRPDGRRSPAYPVLLSLAMRAAPAAATSSRPSSSASRSSSSRASRRRRLRAGSGRGRRLVDGGAARLPAEAPPHGRPPRGGESRRAAAVRLPSSRGRLLDPRLFRRPRDRPRASSPVSSFYASRSSTSSPSSGSPGRWRPAAPAGHLARELVVILVVAHAVLLPWAVRNARALGRFTPFNLVGGVGLFIANNANAPPAVRVARDLELLAPERSRGPRRRRRRRTAGSPALDPRQPRTRRPAVPAPARIDPEGRRLRRGVRDLRRRDPLPTTAPWRSCRDRIRSKAVPPS